jgi:hypothetical protein
MENKCFLCTKPFYVDELADSFSLDPALADLYATSPYELCTMCAQLPLNYLKSTAWELIYLFSHIIYKYVVVDIL